MRLVLGPYDLASPSAAAALALMLGSSDGGVVTLAPAPLEGVSPEIVRRAHDKAPRYLQLLESWRWTGPLWRAGLLRPDHQGASPLEDIRAICQRISDDPQAAPLRALGGSDLFADPDTYLETLSRDLLRGGGDPAVSIPLVAGMERFAARHGLPLVRLAGSSLSARLDKRSSLTLARFTIPSIIGAAAVGYLESRLQLSQQLDDLRSALQTLIAQPPEEAASAHARLNACCRALADAFSTSSRAILEVSARESEPARLAEIAVTVALAPVGASLEAASRAAASLASASPRSVSRARAHAAPAPDPATKTALNLPRAVVFTARPAPWDVSRPSHPA